MVASQRSSVMKELSCFLGGGTYDSAVTLNEKRYISNNIPTEKLIKYGLSKRRVRGTGDWLNCQAQRVVIGDTQAGGQSLAVYPRGQYRDQYYLTSSLMDGKSAPSTSLQVIHSWEDCLIEQMVVIPCRGTLTGWRNEPTGTL